jgi:catechol 2,3-dioxygenase-like lactoylglutathione lyase family enzyme
MHTYLESKAMAKSLRESLAVLDVNLTHGQCLELVAKQFGFADWNILAAKIATGARQPEQAMGGVTLPAPIPVLRVTSLAEARAFYVDFLGFTFDWGDDASADQPVYAQVSRNGVQLHLARESAGGAPGALLFRGVEGLDAYHRELDARRGQFAASAIVFTPWDSREFAVVDPFGNHLRFWENNPPRMARPVA